MGVVTINRNNTYMGYYRSVTQADVRLFCFPYSGAGSSIFYNWSTILPASIEVVAVELPGRGSRLSEPAFTQLQPLVKNLTESLLPYLDRPFAFFGHSMGALVSFELSRLLRAEHALEPIHMFVSGHQAPQIPDNADDPIHDLPDEQLAQKLRELNGTDEEILRNDELRGIILPIIRADFSVCETYSYKPDRPLSCPIDAFGGLGDPYVTRENLDAWSIHTTAPFKARMFPGDHFFLNSSRSLLLRVIAQELLTVKA